MGANLPNTVQQPPLFSREMPTPTMAKADLTVREKRAIYGRILKRACVLAGFDTRKEAAQALGKMDEGQLGRWFSGDENPQTWKFQQHITIGPALIQAQAEAQQGVVVRMSIELPRK